MKYDNNNFIIASRAYFQQSPTCTRVNNLVYIWYKSNTHGLLVLIMFCSWKNLSQRVCHIQIRMYFANLYVSFFDILTYGVKASLDVLGILVRPWLLGVRYGTSVVTIDSHRV